MSVPSKDNFKITEHRSLNISKSKLVSLIFFHTIYTNHPTKTEMKFLAKRSSGQMEATFMHEDLYEQMHAFISDWLSYGVVVTSVLIVGYELTSTFI